MEDAEIITDADGKARLRLPRDILGDTPQKIALLEAEVRDLRAREAQPDRLARTGAAFEAWARDQIDAREHALQASMEKLSLVGEKIVRAVETLTAAIAEKNMSITFAPKFSPNVQASEIKEVNVVSQVQLPPPRERAISIKVDEQGNATGAIS